jgi:glutaminyl-tRNA synthetase
MDELIPLFVKIGLSEQKAEDTAKNKKLAPTLENVIDEAKVRDSGCDKEVGILLYSLATTVTKGATEHIPFIVSKIMNGDLKSTDQVSGKKKGVESERNAVT